MQSDAHYISRLINSPWSADGRHCWRLVEEVQRDLFGRDLPPVLDIGPCGGGEGRKAKAGLFAGHQERARWMEAPGPVHGAVALMRRSAAPVGAFIHAGVYLSIDRGGVLHSDAPHGVVFDTMLELASRGWVPSFFVPRMRDGYHRRSHRSTYRSPH